MAKHVFPSARLHEDLKKVIMAAETGDKLPSEPELAKQLGVARATLREAMRTYEVQGLLYRRQGSGTYVVRPSHIIETGLEVLESIETLADRIGLRVTMNELKIDHRLAHEDEAAALGLAPGQKVIRVERVINADESPAAYLVDVLPEDVISQEELSTNFTGSVLDLLLRRGTPPLASSRTEITAATASHDIGRALGIQRGSVLLQFVAYLYATNGRVIDYSFSYFLPGYFHFHVVRRVGKL
jgi:GntR family transcriptional regulator